MQLACKTQSSGAFVDPCLFFKLLIKFLQEIKLNSGKLFPQSKLPATYHKDILSSKLDQTLITFRQEHTVVQK